MTAAMDPPTDRTGKICASKTPASDDKKSAEFYRRAFGWKTRQRGDGSTAFDDTVNEVSGTWVLGRPVATEPGLMVYIMVASAAEAVEAVRSAGGENGHQVDPPSPQGIPTLPRPAGKLIRR